MEKPDLKPVLSLISEWPVPDSSGMLLAKKPQMEIKFEGHENSRKSSGHASGTSTDSEKKGSCGQLHTWYVAVPNITYITFFSVKQVVAPP